MGILGSLWRRIRGDGAESEQPADSSEAKPSVAKGEARAGESAERPTSSRRRDDQSESADGEVADVVSPAGGFADDEPVSPERRDFLIRLSVTLGAIGAAIVSIPLLGLLLSPVLRRDPKVWRVVGAIDSFAIGETVSVAMLDPEPLPWAGFAARSAAWLRRESEQDFVAFSVYCTHVGCPVRWSPSANLFLCPCHGGVFYRDGTVAAGPPPRPLERVQVRLREGQVELLASPVPLPTAPR